VATAAAAALLCSDRAGQEIHPDEPHRSSWNQSPSAIYWCAPSCFVFISVLSHLSPPRGSKSHLLCCLGRWKLFEWELSLLSSSAAPFAPARYNTATAASPATRCSPSIPFHSRLLLPNCFFGEPMRSRHHALADSSQRPIGLRHVETSQTRQPINGEYREHIICDRTMEDQVASLPT